MRHPPDGSNHPPDHAPREDAPRPRGLALITGASDNDPVAIGTYATAGAKFGVLVLWTAPMLFPMMFAVVYLSSRLGQISERGLFAVIQDHYPRWVVWLALGGALIDNVFEASADIAGMAAALNLFIPVPIPWLTIPIAAAILAMQIVGSYTLIRNIFRWLALTLLAYIGAAIISRPPLPHVLSGTLVPHSTFDREYLSILVAIIGASLSAYIYTWQSNV